MSQTNVQNHKALRFGSGVLEVSSDDGNTWVNVGALKEGQAKFDLSVSEIKFDNAKLPPKAKINEFIFSAKLGEINLATIYKLISIGTFTATPGTAETETDKTLVPTGGIWKKGELIKIQDKNANGTAVNVTALKNNSTAITDYEVVLQNGETYLLNTGSSNLTANGANGINATYTFTPAEAVQILYKDLLENLSTNRFRFVNTDENGKKFGIEIYEGYNRAGVELLFRPDDDVENVMELPIELKAYPVSGSNNLFRIFDEQAV